jgi:hypothetical protein
MPRHSQDDLYKLVRGLTSAEKGYVRRFFSRYADDADQAYIELFDLLNDMESFDPATYKRLVGERSWAKRATAVKAYCMARVLEALRSFHASSTPARQLNELLDDADNLLDHGLYEEAEKRAVKARRSAQEQEAFLPLLRSLAWLKRFRQLVRNDYDPPADEEDLNTEQRRVLALYENSIAFEEVGNAMHKHLIRSGAGDAASTKWMNAAMDRGVMTSPSNALSLSSLVNYHLIKCNWHRMYKDDPASALKEATVLNTLRESNAPYFTSRVELSETILFTYLSCALEARQPDVFERHADAFYSKGARSERKVRRATRSWMLEANYALYNKTYDRLMAVEPGIRHFYVRQGEQIPPHYLSTLIFTMVRVGNESGDQDLFQYWSQQLMKIDDAVRPDLHAAAMVNSCGLWTKEIWIMCVDASAVLNAMRDVICRSPSHSQRSSPSSVACPTLHLRAHARSVQRRLQLLQSIRSFRCSIRQAHQA